MVTMPVTASRRRVLRAYRVYRQNGIHTPAEALALVQLDADQLIAKPPTCSQVPCIDCAVTEATWDSFYASRYAKVVQQKRIDLPYWNLGVTARSEE